MLQERVQLHAQLLRSIRALHILHRNAQRHQVTRRDPATGDLTYSGRVVVELGSSWCRGGVVVVVGFGRGRRRSVVKTRFSFTGPMGWVRDS